MNVDISKLVVALLGFLFFNFKVKKHISPRNIWFINVGLFLILCASVLDFTDGVNSLKDVPIFGREDPLHDFLEDQVFDTLGLALFIFGVFRGVLKKKD